MAKGGNFEREISKKLSLWLTKNKMNDAVWHTSGSGGRATNRKKNKKEIVKKYDYGDLSPDHPITYPFFDCFSIELKTGYTKVTKKKGNVTKTMWSLLDDLDSSQDVPKFNEFWDQCLDDAINSKRDPILIFRRTYREPCVAMFDYSFNLFIKNHGTPLFNFIIYNKDSIFSIVICNLYQFMNWSKDINILKLKYQIIKEKIKDRRNQ